MLQLELRMRGLNVQDQHHTQLLLTMIIHQIVEVAAAVASEVEAATITTEEITTKTDTTITIVTSPGHLL